MDLTYESIQTFSHLPNIGINILTGEACKFSQRLLCDVNEEGLALLRDFFGIASLTLNANWNSSVGETSAIGSIMLTRETLWQITIFAMLRKGYRWVFWHEERREIMASMEDYRTGKHAELFKEHRVFHNPHAAALTATRNTHQMSGRVE